MRNFLCLLMFSVVITTAFSQKAYSDDSKDDYTNNAGWSWTLDDDHNQTGEGFRWWKDGGNNIDQLLMQLTESKNLNLFGDINFKTGEKQGIYQNTNARNSPSWLEMYDGSFLVNKGTSLGGKRLFFYVNSSTVGAGFRALDINENGTARFTVVDEANGNRLKEEAVINPKGLHINRLLKKGEGYLPISVGDKELVQFHKDYVLFSNGYVSFANSKGEVKTKIQDGIISTDKVLLNVTSFPDYVFDKNYDLMPLQDVKDYVKKHKHLPNMPSEAEVVAKGMDVAKINTALVEKVEELLLYTISQEEQIQKLDKELESLKSTVKQILKNNN